MSILKIRRSAATAAPSALENGELAYSQVSQKLFVGRPGGTTGDIDTIGGKHYTDIIDTNSANWTAAYNDKINSATFSTANGQLTLTQQDGGTVVVGLDGRYLTSYAESDTLDSVTDRGATTTNAVTVGGLTVTGNLTVQGTTTTVNSETVTIADNFLTLNSNVTGTPSEDSGIEVERGTATNVALRWSESNGRWEFTNDGTTYNAIGASTIDTEAVQDIVGAMVSGNTEANITVTYNDAGAKLNFSVADAGTSTKGVASFNSTEFTVTNGGVALNVIDGGESF